MGTPYMDAARARERFTPARLAELFAYDPRSGDITILKTGKVAVRKVTGYVVVYADGAVMFAHRVAVRMVTGEWPADMVDHIDGDRANNRWANLRQAGSSLNAQNQKRAMSTSKTGHLGVVHQPGRTKPYRAQIELDGRKRHVGSFSTADEAHTAYLDAKAALHPHCGPRAHAQQGQE